MFLVLGAPETKQVPVQEDCAFSTKPSLHTSYKLEGTQKSKVKVNEKEKEDGTSNTAIRQ